MNTRPLALLCALLIGLTSVAQKPKTVEFSAAGLPDELLEYMNKSTSDSDRQKENTKTLKAFKPVYGSLDGAMQQRIAELYTYGVKAKLKGNPDMCNLTRALTAYASTPGNGANFDAFVKGLEQMKQKSAKAKGVNEYVDFCQGLLDERVLYKSNSCEWRFAKGTPFNLEVKGGAVLVRFDVPADLNYFSNKDHNVIRSTTGVYDYKENRWKGKGGRVDWARTGLPAADCYADLASYELETKFPKFKADSVMFVNVRYFDNPIPGRLEEALSNVMAPEKYNYPRFRSYQRDFVIKDIMPEVDYSGSFMMNGSKFITASSKHPARLIFNQGGKPRLAVTSLKFTVTPERMHAENATVALFVGKEDSIANTGITVRYVPADKQVVLVNDSKRNFYSPYIDTYHQLDIYSESLVWRVDRDEVLFSNLGAAGAVSSNTFESSSYYTFSKYRQIKGIDQESPVARVYDYSRSVGSEFGVQGFSNHLGLDMSQTLLMIHTLSRHGLVSFNEITGRVYVKEKLIDYHKAFSRSKDFDYDALTLESTAAGTNARLSIEDGLLHVRGVSQFVVSDSQSVVVYPDSLTGNMVTVGQNRTLHFSGRINVGKFILTVKDADFSYEDFSFNMPTIERMEFYVPDFKDNKYEQLVRTPLNNLVGTLAVDKPDNHNGLTKNKEYPIFKSTENSFVYYDRPEIQGRQYDRERFYYTLHPFTINSMLDFVTDSLQFNGVLTSAGIFPDIKEPLRVQKDYYLGFRTATPAGGYPAYGGKGTYSNKISLDHNGLRGAGAVGYLVSHSTSKDYLFLPDSMVAVTDTFSVKEEQGFPDIRNGRASMHWLPYQDSMAVATLDKGRPFSMYRGDASLRGRVALMPQGASAAGTAVVREGTFESKHFALASREMSANVSNFTLRSTKFNTVAFTATDIASNVNYDTRRADLQSKQGPVRTELQLVQYEAWADRFSWEMDRKELDLLNSTRETSEGMESMDIRMRLQKASDMPGVRFVSTDPAQQRLSYHSLRSIYKYDLGDLSSQGVYLINVADAAIAPAADSVHINKGGGMRVLNNASLVCDREHAYHYIFNADLIVNASNSYTGKGYIDYQDDLKKKQRIFLSDIGVRNGVTVAQGSISDSASFSLSSAFGFAGKARVEGNRQWIFFEGGVRLIQPCIPENQLALLAYADYTDPEHIHVTVPEQPTDWKGNRITASILMDKTTLQPHAAFLTNEKVADNELLSAHGVLTHLGDSKQYMIGSEEKVADPDAVVGPYLSLSTSDCVVEGEGIINFPMRRTQAGFYAYGTASVGMRDSQEDYLTTVFGINFPIDASLVASLYSNLKEDLRLSSIGSTTNAEMRHALMHHLGADKGAAAYALYSSTGELEKVPDAMKGNLLFDNVRWQYLPGWGLYYDGKVGLVAAGDKALGVQVNLKAQIFKRGNSQQMIFFVQAARDHWYFFKYDLGTSELTIYTSNGTWADQVKALPLDQRKVEKEGLPMFRYFVGNNSSEVQTWLTRFSKSVYSEEDDF
ncbi:MAG: hypothetical protein J6I49_06140 [Bacteroidales bacterium]|nr:hypothetical protein [Bacteroidales bacterium]